MTKIQFRARRCVLPVLLATVCCGCGTEGQPKIDVLIDTLAGGAVRVVNILPDWQKSAWVLREDLRIGSVHGTGPDVFTDVVDLLVDNQGSI